MNRTFLFIVLLIIDIFAIFFSIFVAVSFRKFLNFFMDIPEITYSYLSFWAVYVTLIIVLIYSGIYTKRFDFWHETKIILRGSFISFIIILSGLALGQNVDFYSRSTLILIFFFSSFILPIFKIVFKNILFRLGYWQKPAKIISNNDKFKHELFENHYLGYIKSNDSEHKTVFIDGSNIDKDKLNMIIERNIRDNREIIFTPILSEYDFSHSYIYNLFNSRVNIFTLENEMLSKFNILTKGTIDYILVSISSVIWFPALLIISILIKLENPKGKIFFTQKRLGKNGRKFLCYKFRTMNEDQSFMNKWLEEHPEEKQYYHIYHKYMNDPRITRIGNFLRRTSLDELPQLINIIRGEMSLVGPRPYMVSEKKDIGAKLSLVLALKPGITGLWQVSGRSEVNFSERVNIDVWYMKNWSLWNDIVILLKTINVVLKRDGAY